MRGSDLRLTVSQFLSCSGVIIAILLQILIHIVPGRLQYLKFASR